MEIKENTIFLFTDNIRSPTFAKVISKTDKTILFSILHIEEIECLVSVGGDSVTKYLPKNYETGSKFRVRKTSFEDDCCSCKINGIMHIGMEWDKKVYKQYSYY